MDKETKFDVPALIKKVLKFLISGIFSLIIFVIITPIILIKFFLKFLAYTFGIAIMYPLGKFIIILGVGLILEIIKYLGFIDTATTNEVGNYVESFICRNSKGEFDFLPSGSFSYYYFPRYAIAGFIFALLVTIAEIKDRR